MYIPFICVELFGYMYLRKRAYIRKVLGHVIFVDCLVRTSWAFAMHFMCCGSAVDGFVVD